MTGRRIIFRRRLQSAARPADIQNPSSASPPPSPLGNFEMESLPFGCAGLCFWPRRLSPTSFRVIRLSKWGGGHKRLWGLQLFGCLQYRFNYYIIVISIHRTGPESPNRRQDYPRRVVVIILYNIIGTYSVSGNRETEPRAKWIFRHWSLWGGTRWKRRYTIQVHYDKLWYISFI